MIRRCSESKVEEKPNIKCNMFQSGMDSLMSSSEETGGLWTGGSSIRVATCTPYAFQHFYFPVFMYDKGRAEASHGWRKNNLVPKQVLLITIALALTVFLNVFSSLFTGEDQDVSLTCSIVHLSSQNPAPHGNNSPWNTAEECDCLWVLSNWESKAIPFSHLPLACYYQI